MNRDIPVQVAYDRTNKGVDIRNASTANFLIDSADRSQYNESTVLSLLRPLPGVTSANFQITKPGQNLITGFFTRLAMSEIVLNWNVYNVSATVGNNSTIFSLRNSGGTVIDYPVTLRRGNYTVKEALDALAIQMGLVTGLVFTIVDSVAVAGEPSGRKAIQAPAGFTFAFVRSTPVPASPAPYTPDLAQSLGFIVYDGGSLPLPLATDFRAAWVAYKPSLLPYEYIDITSSQISSQQKVKDATTSPFDAIDVIYRWNFVSDESYPVEYDTYGYPILPGYKPFSAKRTLSFPKQIRWDPLLPIGNLSFQTYTDKETLLQYDELEEDYEFKMLMLISEV